MTHNGKPVEILYQEFPQELRGEITGLVTAKFQDKYIILIDSTRHPITQRQTLGHELAHIFLNHLDQHDRPIKEQEQEAGRATWYYYREYKAGRLGAGEALPEDTAARAEGGGNRQAV